MEKPYYLIIAVLVQKTVKIAGNNIYYYFHRAIYFLTQTIGIMRIKSKNPQSFKLFFVSLLFPFNKLIK